MNKVNVEKVVDYANLLSENEKLHSIIKEVREYLEDRQEDINNGGNEYEYRCNRHILEILNRK